MTQFQTSTVLRQGNSRDLVDVGIKSPFKKMSNSLCVHICTRDCGWVLCVQICVEVRRWLQASFSVALHLFYKTEFLTKPGAYIFSSTGQPMSLKGSASAAPTLEAFIALASFYMGSRGCELTSSCFCDEHFGS